MRKKRIIADNLKIIIITCIVSTICSLSLGYATDILFAGNEVSYDNSVSGLNATTVQGALDEMCTVADFSDRVSTLEGYFKNSPTSYFNGNWLNIKSTDNSTRGVVVYDSSNIQRSYFYYSTSEALTRIDSQDNSGSTGKGGLKIVAKPITLDATTGGSGNINLKGTVKINDATVYAYENGSYGVWTWRKYSDGTFDLWARNSTTATHFTTINGFYGYQLAFSFPTGCTPINGQYIASLNFKVGTGFSSPAGHGTYGTTGFVAYVLANQSGQQTIEYDVYVHGKWQ